MNLDERARQATAGLRATVAASPLSSPIPGMARWEWVPRALAAVGTAAAIVVVAILTIQVAPPTPAPITQPPDGTVIPEFVPPVEDSLLTTDTTELSTVTSLSEGDPIAPSGPEGTAGPGEVPADTEAPSLVILSPVNGQVFETDVVRFSGTTEPGAAVRAGRYEADVAPDGTWSIVLILSPGSNRAVFTATDVAGNETTAQVVVDYKRSVADTTTTTTKPKEDTTTTTKADFVEFSANQVYGTCPSSPPFDVFWGTAQPGSKVIVTSDYGGGSVFANAEGGWELRVEFPEAPADVFFLVTAKSVATGRAKSFEFAYKP
ncbi:MAG: hypothetical protein OEY55_07555 [Acidimicrobiia bacterium]|nr:hypothetical protein [Acidimicrobiia bacterium]